MCTDCRDEELLTFCVLTANERIQILIFVMNEVKLEVKTKFDGVVICDQNFGLSRLSK